MGAKTRPRKKSSAPKYDKRAGEEVRTEMHHMREGKHPVKNRKQAIAIGLAKAREKGEKVPSPPSRRPSPRKPRGLGAPGRRAA
jgi:hypothetical protein